MRVVNNKRETLRSNFYLLMLMYLLSNLWQGRDNLCFVHCQRHSFPWVWNIVAPLYMFIETIKFIRREGKSWWRATCRENIKCQRYPGLLERGKRCFWYNDLGYLIELDSWFLWQERGITRVGWVLVKGCTCHLDYQDDAGSNFLGSISCRSKRS